MSFRKGLLSTSSSGLANRLRAHSSVFRVARKLGRVPAIHWPLTNQLNAGFFDLFEPGWPIVGQTQLEEWVFRTELTTKTYNCSDSKSILENDPEDVLVIKSWDFFGVGSPTHHDLEEDIDELRKLKPLDWVSSKIADVKSKLKSPYIGLHIRTCDIIGVHYGERSVPERIHYRFSDGPGSFISEVRQAVERGFLVFVSSDDIDCEIAVEKAFPGKVVRQEKSEEWRKTATGMSEAVTDLYLLAGAKAILGSRSSQFSSLASELGGIPLFVAGDGKFRLKLIN